MNKVVATIGVCLILITLLSGCKNKGSGVSAAEASQSETEPKRSQNLGETEKSTAAMEDAFLLSDAEDGLKSSDEEICYKLCEALLTDYLNAIHKDKSINLNKYISNKNLKSYMDKKIRASKYSYGSFRMSINKNTAEYKTCEKAGKAYFYLILSAEVSNNESGYGDLHYFIVVNDKARLYVADWYVCKPSLDEAFRGSLSELNDPYVWENDRWAKEVISNFDGLLDG